MSLIHCGLNHFSVVTGGVARSCDGCSMRGGPHGGAGQVSSECPQLTWPEPVHPALPRDSPTSPCINEGDLALFTLCPLASNRGLNPRASCPPWAVTVSNIESFWLLPVSS